MAGQVGAEAGRVARRKCREESLGGQLLLELSWGEGDVMTFLSFVPREVIVESECEGGE